ncbi:MAG: glyoxylate/hydroxypyruvate reductase A, partial [Moorea sp. SIO3E2]|nr:glyoxylate/hydroxypyruvate reductase A [Moorena sp. SIO3E2]
MAVLLLVNIDLEEWFAQLTAELKKRKAGLDLRIWPESGKLDEIEIVLAWWPPLGVMQKLPNLKLIISLGASVDRILVDPDL